MSFTSTDENNEGSLDGVIKTALKKFQQNLQIMLPCIVTKVDRNKNKVSVIPLMRVILTDGTTQKRNEIYNVPIANLSTKNFIINLPIEVGDYGYIKTCDRDISLFKQTFKESKPNTLRKNDFADSVFYPDTINYNNWDIAEEDANSLVIQYKDNSTKISMSENKIILQADTIEQRATNHIFTNGTIKHDGVSIDKNHTHSQNPDSAGNSQQTTNPPNN